jgi:peroxiredoxin
VFTASDDGVLATYGERLLGSARRLNLIGNKMVLEGKTLDGSTFNIKQYRGKVVLVEFWATWCGPCVAELPNVQRNYKQYHDQGFEVVGVSLDTDRDRLEEFLAKHELPWVCLFEDDAGWDHPLAKQYGLLGIPFAVLVDRQGRGVTFETHGSELDKQLETLLGGSR